MYGQLTHQGYHVQKTKVEGRIHMASSIIDNSEMKLQRMNKLDGAQLSRRAYNVVIGMVLVFGLAVNAAMAVLLPASAFELMAEHPWAVIIGFLVLSFGSIFIIYKSDNPALSFLGFVVLSVTFGYLVAAAVQSYTDVTVTRAFMLTAIITFAMMGLATAFPKVFAKMGIALFAVLAVAIVAQIVVVLVTGSYPGVFDLIFVVVFSLYIGYDWQKSQAYPPTLDNAVDSAADIYVDIINLFIRLLALLGRRD